MKVRSLLLGLAAAGALASGALATAFYYPEVFDARVRAYKRFYTEIEPGMTRDQVWAAVERIYFADGARTRPIVLRDSGARLSFFMHQEGCSGPNCEGIFLDFADGVVARREYCRD